MPAADMHDPGQGRGLAGQVESSAAPAAGGGSAYRGDRCVSGVVSGVVSGADGGSFRILIGCGSIRVSGAGSSIGSTGPGCTSSGGPGGTGTELAKGDIGGSLIGPMGPTCSGSGGPEGVTT